MPTLPWTVPNTPPRDAVVHVFASRFETRTVLGALRFLTRTAGVWRQVGRAPGAYGASLRAQPLKRTFWTLSAWESAEALKAFARSGTHAPTSQGLAGEMKDVRFASWTTPADRLPLPWEEAVRRLK
ncbi:MULTISPECIES: DUF3291 domain-containing protein [unclassified Streptomyces]|uniref:DUF3291 domain-containing protein n=1 Tax=unclassified Streptomyces TaxID=2593676 RepID=UPI001F03833D|nr:MULTISPECIES: DUF3291 domain-containing protein [unclassified Streptomyces]MCH0563268.1 DUF3291 domain-containing protein [Streptomyces sp. MUM 2J]MCH0568681.1 DUF3291 domain-containing protein [Streptomyces sp. MUM 136J]